VNRASSPVVLKKLSVLFVCFGCLALAPARPDFSGSYAVGEKAAGGTAPAAVVLHVVQTESFVEVTRLQDGGSFTNRFPLDGKDGEYTSPTGVRGKCKARFSKETLVLETAVLSQREGRQPMRLETREDWRLSKDLGRLTVKTEIRSPDMPADIAAMAFPNNPRTDTYQRTTER
jgi:hypothetical protein